MYMTCINIHYYLINNYILWINTYASKLIFISILNMNMYSNISIVPILRIFIILFRINYIIYINNLYNYFFIYY